MTDTKSATDRPIMFGTPVEEAMTELAAISTATPPICFPQSKLSLPRTTPNGSRSRLMRHSRSDAASAKPGHKSSEGGRDE